MTSDTSEEPKREVKTGAYTGLAWCLLHVCLLATASTLVKFSQVPAEFKLFIRSCVQFFCLLPIITRESIKNGLDVLDREKIKVLLIRGTLGPLGSIALYNALDRIALGDAVSITFTNAVFAGIFGKLFLNEKYTLLDFFFASVSFIGVVLISKPSFIFGKDEKNYEGYELVGVGLALLNAITISLVMIAIRSLGKVNPVLNVFYFSFCGSLIGGIWAFLMNQFYVPCMSELICVFTIGLVALGSQIAITKALQTEKASTVAIFRSMQLILVFIIQVSLTEYSFFCVKYFIKRFILINTVYNV